MKVGVAARRRGGAAFRKFNILLPLQKCAIELLYIII